MHLIDVYVVCEKQLILMLKCNLWSRTSKPIPHFNLLFTSPEWVLHLQLLDVVIFSIKDRAVMFTFMVIQDI